MSTLSSVRRTLFQGAFVGGYTEATLHGAGHVQGDHVPTEPVHNSHKVDKSATLCAVEAFANGVFPQAGGVDVMGLYIHGFLPGLDSLGDEFRAGVRARELGQTVVNEGGGQRGQHIRGLEAAPQGNAPTTKEYGDLPALLRRKNFFDSTSFMASISRSRSATRGLRRAFSCSNVRNSFTLATFRLP